MWIEQYSIYIRNRCIAPRDGARYDDLLRCVAAHFNVKSDKVRTVSSAIHSYTYLYIPTKYSVIHLIIFDISQMLTCVFFVTATAWHFYLYYSHKQTSTRCASSSSSSSSCRVVGYAIMDHMWPGLLMTRKCIHYTGQHTHKRRNFCKTSAANDALYTVCNINANTINTQVLWINASAFIFAI